MRAIIVIASLGVKAHQAAAGNGTRQLTCSVTVLGTGDRRREATVEFSHQSYRVTPHSCSEVATIDLSSAVTASGNASG
jgi:hypothetical protein